MVLVMESKNILKDKSYQFSLDIIKLCKYLQETQKERILSNQVLRSGTAIDALLCEAEYAQSLPDFINKLSISLKEANEIRYWIRLLRDSMYIEQSYSKEFLDQLNQLISMLISSINTSKRKLKEK